MSVFEIRVVDVPQSEKINDIYPGQLALPRRVQMLHTLLKIQAWPQKEAEE